MKRYFPAILFCLNACSTIPSSNSYVEQDDDSGLSIRRVEVTSDVAMIRADYQIVIGSTRQVLVDQRVQWGTQPIMQVSPAGTPAKAASSDAPPALAKPSAVKQDKSVYLDEAHFEFGSATLKKSAMLILDRVIADIERIAPKRIAVLGHADSVGGADQNQKLSEKRADAVFAYLKLKGMSIGTVERVGFGARAPVADNKTSIGREKNRRVEIIATVNK